MRGCQVLFANGHQFYQGSLVFPTYQMDLVLHKCVIVLKPNYRDGKRHFVHGI